MTLFGLFTATALAQSLPNQQNNMEGPATGFGVGAVVGTPSGLAISWRPNPSRAIQAATGFSGQQGRFALNADFVQTVWVLFNEDDSWILPLYVGGGLRYRALSGSPDQREADQDGIGLRAPIGMRIYPEDIRLDIFAEVAPALHLRPEPTFAFDVGIGVRLWAGKPET